MKIIYKKIIALLLFVTITSSLIFNDYKTAEASATAGAVIVGAEALLALIMTAFASNGVTVDLEEINLGYTVNEYREAYQEVQNGSKSVQYGKIVAEYNGAVRKFYRNVMADMIATGVLTEEDDTECLEYLFSVFDFEDSWDVTKDQVKNALNSYVDTRTALEDFRDNGKLFSIVGNTIGIGVNMFGDLIESVGTAVHKYVNTAYRNELTVSYGNISFDFSSTFEFDEKSDIYTKLNYIHNKLGANTTTPYFDYVIIGHNLSSNSPTYSLYNSHTIYKLIDNQGLYSFYLPRHRYSYYDSTGKLVQEYHLSKGSSITSGTVVYWSGLKTNSSYGKPFGENLVSHPYGSEADTSGRDKSIPINGDIADLNISNGDKSVTLPSDYVLSNEDTFGNVVNGLISSVDTIAGAVDDINERAEQWVASITDTIVSADEKAKATTDEVVIGAIDTELGIVAFKLDDFTTSGLGSKFPFCIPFDLINCVKMLQATAKAPRWEIPFKFDKIGVNEKIVIDLSKFEPVVKVIRVCELFGFIGFLIVKTRGIIKG